MATRFRMRMLIAQGSAVVDGGWEDYITLPELHRATREVSKGNAFTCVESSSNAHYRATGHMRYVWQVPGGRARVVIHALTR